MTAVTVIATKALVRPWKIAAPRHAAAAKILNSAVTFTDRHAGGDCVETPLCDEGFNFRSVKAVKFAWVAVAAPTVVVLGGLELSRSSRGPILQAMRY